MENLPGYVNVVFILTSILTLWFLYRATHRSNLLLGTAMVWLALQGIVASSGYYLITQTLPPRFIFLVLPPVLTVIYFFVTKRGKAVVDSLDTTMLTYLQSVRLPVELVLWWLFLSDLIPELMTFEGRNLDIFTGVTAPLIAFYGYTKHKLNKTVVLIWHFICLGLLFNIVIHAILSAPFAFQQLAFDQPNIGVFYFPFVWLPGFIVPTALFSHLVCIRRIIISGRQ